MIGFLIRWLIRLWKSVFGSKQWKSRTVFISGFPQAEDAVKVKDFIETHTGPGTVFAVNFRPNNHVPFNTSAHVIVQFTTPQSADDLLSKASTGIHFGQRPLTVKPRRDIVPRPKVPALDLHGISLHLGCPLSRSKLSVLVYFRDVHLRLSRNLRTIVFFLSWKDRRYKFEYSYDGIREIRRHISPSQDSLSMTVALAPKIYVLPKRSSRSRPLNYFKDPHEDERWIRTTDFTEFRSIGQASVFCLELPSGASLPEISEMFAYCKKVDFPLRLERGFSYSQDLSLVPIVSPRDKASVPYGILFAVNQMVQKGTLSGPTLGDDFFRLLNPNIFPLTVVERALQRLSITDVCCFAPEKWLREQYEKEKSTDVTSARIPLQAGQMYVYRAQVTPSKVYFFGPEVNLSNRVVRHFMPYLENFIRVSFVDENGEKLWSNDLQPRQTAVSSDRQTELYRRIQAVLKNGISVGEKRFEFLAFSASQLKESSVWMFASTPELSAADIRRWMGDFSSIRNVAKYAARLGQSFGSSTETLSVARHEIEMIPDAENDKYCFSDGIGKISAAFADEVAKKCSLRRTPSAFQIRYAGFKGVVAVDPSSRVKLSLRKSMLKFESENTKLDVLAYSKPQACFLNRQVITLLSTLGVRDEVFQRKQAELVAKLDESLTDPDQAMEVLSATSPGEMAGVLKEMLLCGYVPGEEPFLTVMLHALWTAKVNDLRTKSRILVPKGRALIGCMDETCTLQYGEAFVQVSSLSSSSSPPDGHGGKEIITGKVVVAKNPCLYPGDVRVLQAVDVPGLRHMINCVVFPQRGKRPHPNECSGSDLDGDVYFVSWDSELIPSRQVEPMDYTPAPPSTLNRDVTIEDVQEYFVNYMVNDTLGVIANAHTTFADRDPEKAMSLRCKKLAELFSIAVDFPKTGVPAVIPPQLSVQEFPDFMEKHHKASYWSSGVIGKLFRAVKEKGLSATAAEFSPRDAAKFYDRGMEVSGFERHVERAFSFKGEYDLHLSALMNHYAVDTEAEFLLGGSMKRVKGLNRHRDGDAVRLAARALKNEARSWFNRWSREGDNVAEDFVLAKASAWYHVTYHPDYWGRSKDGLTSSHCLSFPWCIHERLISIKMRSQT